MGSSRYAHTISRHADGISWYSVPASAGPLLPLHTRVDQGSVRHFPHWKGCSKNAKKCQKPCQKQPLLLKARGLPFNTWMPGPTPLTMPNDSSIAVCTSTQRHNKVPFGYNGTTQIHPQNCPFPFDDHHQNLMHPYQARPHSPPQTASRSNQPFCHSSHVQTFASRRHGFLNEESNLTQMIHCTHYLQNIWVPAVRKCPQRHSLRLVTRAKHVGTLLTCSIYRLSNEQRREACNSPYIADKNNICPHVWLT